MAGPDQIVASKLANGLFHDAEMSETARGALLLGSDSAVDWLSRRMGGLWVGGRVTLTCDGLIFAPNAINRAAHEGDIYWSIPLGRIESVADRFGVLTRIVDVRTQDGETYTFRCFGAKAIAELIRRTATAAV